MPMKKIAAAALTMLMAISLSLTALAAGPADERVTPNMEGLSNVGSVYDSAAGILTYYLTAEPTWEGMGEDAFIRLVTGIVVPAGAATYTVNGEAPPNNGTTPPVQGFGARYDKPSTAQTSSNTMNVRWFDSEGTLLDDTDEIVVRVVPAYMEQTVSGSQFDHPVYDDSNTPACLNAAGIGYGDGMITYRLKEGIAPEGESVTTYVYPPDELAGAAAYRYKLDGDSIESGSGDYISVVDAIPKLSEAEPKSDVPHTIEWYNGDNILVATQSFKTRFKLSAEEMIEPFDYATGLDKTFLNAIGCSTEVVTITDEDGGEQQCLDITLPQKTATQWKGLFFGPYNSASDVDSFMVRTSFAFPADTQWYARVGTRIGLGDSEAINTLKNIPSGFKLDPFNDFWSFLFASVTYDSANAVISPQESDRSLLIKYMDGDDELHYTRLNYRIRYGSPGTSYVMENVVPLGSRVIPDARFRGEYGDGIVSYTIDSYGGGVLSPVTRIAPPAAIAATAKNLSVNGEAPISIADGYASQTYSYTGGREQFTGPLKLEWLDESDSVLYAEMMSINIIPAFSGKWVDTRWQPVAAERTGAYSSAIAAGAKLGYDPDEGIWRFTIDESKLSSLNMGYFTGDYSDLIAVTPPDGAAYFLCYMSHDPLYAEGFETGAASYFTSEEAGGRYEAVPGNGAPLPLPYRQPCSRTTMDATNGEVTVFAVNKTMTGYANYVVFQWYDSDYNLIAGGGGRGEYVLLIMDPFYRSTDNRVTTAPVSATALTGPTAVSDRPDSLSYMLKTQTPVQQNNSASTDYLVMNLIYLDENGKETQPADGETVTVYLPYPDGVTYRNAAQYAFTLRHYKSGDLNGESTLVELVPTPYGLSFHTDSFSPFLRSCVKKTANTGDSNAPSYRLAYAGGNGFSASAAVKKVEVNGVEMPFIQTGGNFIIPGLTDGEHSIRVTFDDGSTFTLNITVYGTPAVVVEVPQTGGDASEGLRLGIAMLAASMLVAGIFFAKKKREG